MFVYRSITIPIGTKVSAVFPTYLAEGNGYQAAAIIFTSAMTSAILKFNAALTSNGTLYRLRKPMTQEDASISAGASATGWVGLDLETFATPPFLQLEGDSNEAATRTIVVAFRPV